MLHIENILQMSNLLFCAAGKVYIHMTHSCKHSAHTEHTTFSEEPLTQAKGIQTAPSPSPSLWHHPSPSPVRSAPGCGGT